MELKTAYRSLFFLEWAVIIYFIDAPKKYRTALCRCMQPDWATHD